MMTMMMIARIHKEPQGRSGVKRDKTKRGQSRRSSEQFGSVGDFWMGRMGRGEEGVCCHGEGHVSQAPPTGAVGRDAREQTSGSKAPSQLQHPQMISFHTSTRGLEAVQLAETNVLSALAGRKRPCRLHLTVRCCFVLRLTRESLNIHYRFSFFI